MRHHIITNPSSNKELIAHLYPKDVDREGNVVEFDRDDLIEIGLVWHEPLEPDDSREILIRRIHDAPNEIQLAINYWKAKIQFDRTPDLEARDDWEDRARKAVYYNIQLRSNTWHLLNNRSARNAYERWLTGGPSKR